MKLFTISTQRMTGVMMIGAALALPAAATAQTTYNTVLLSGDAAPGAGGGVTFADFRSPRINASGQIAFVGTVTGAGVGATNDQGVWSNGAGPVALVAREGDVAPGAGAGVVFDNSFTGFRLALSDQGETTLSSALSSGTNLAGVWTDRSGSLAELVLVGDPAPGAGAGVVFDQPNGDFFSTRSSQGKVVFQGNLLGTGVDPTNNTGIWSESGGSLGLVQRLGDPAPGFDPGVTVNNIGPPESNGLGQAAFDADVTGPGVTAGVDDSMLYAETGSSLRIVAREGDVAPGVGIAFMSVNDRYDINDSGRVALFGRVFAPPETIGGIGGGAGGGGGADPNSGVWSDAAGPLSLVHFNGNPAPGLAAGVTLGVTGDPHLNNAGQVAFEGTLSGPGVGPTNEQSIWLESNGALALALRQGDAAPGAGAGVTFSAFDGIQLNNAGQIRVSAILTGPGITAANDTGVWLIDPIAGVVKVLQNGDQINVSNNPGNPDLRTVTGETVFDSVFNDAGQFLFSAEFTDTSRALVRADTFFRLPGDADNDGDVDLDDFNILAANFGLGPAAAGAFSIGDFDLDGSVTLDDFNILAANFGLITEETAGALPEPGALVLLVGCGIAVAVRRPAAVSRVV